MTDEIPDLLIWVLKSKLSDGSEVFKVDLNGETYDCISGDDAVEMAGALADLFGRHTNLVAEVIYDHG